jgi:hypothetical protein
MMGIVYVMQMEAEEKRVGARNGFSSKSRRQPRVLPRPVGTSRDGLQVTQVPERCARGHQPGAQTNEEVC